MMSIVNSTEELLTAIVKVLSLEIRGKVCIGYQSIQLTGGVKTLTVPTGAISAELTLEINDANTAKMVGARYTLHGVDPETGNTSDKLGIPMGDGDTIELRGPDNMVPFRIIDSGNGSNSRYLKVVYFK